MALPAGEAPGDERHDWRVAGVDLEAYPGSQRSMGRDDPLFVASALAAGTVLAGIMPR